jgi:hypothetical protein
VKLAEWEEKRANGEKGQGHKPAKPKMPTVWHDLLTEDELLAATAAVMVRAENGVALLAEHAVIVGERPEQDPERDNDDEHDRDNSGADGSGSESEEEVDLEGEDFSEEDSDNSE